MLVALFLLTLLPPVPGEVARPFDYGSDPFARGQHRGVDLEAPPGERVRAACAGQVVAAGRVVRTGVVSIRCGRYRVSHLPLDRITVEPGAAVRRGARIGTVAAGHGGLHLGMRREGDPFGYVDPTPRLLRAGDPPSMPLLRTPGRRFRVPGLPRPAPVPGPRGVPGRARVPAPAPGSAPAAPAARWPAVVPARPDTARSGSTTAPWYAFAGLALVLAGTVTGGVSRRRRRRPATAPGAAATERAA